MTDLIFNYFSFQFSHHQYGLLAGRQTAGATRSRSLTPSLSSQFAFPFLNNAATAAATSPSPLGLGLFDTDPSRLLTLLHHQTLLAEEALRYRGLLFGGATSANLNNTKEPPRMSPLTEMLMKEQQEHFSKFNPIFKDTIRYPLFMPDLSITRTNSSKLIPEDLRSEKQRNAEDNLYKRPRSLINNETHFDAKRLKECRDLLRNATPSPIASSLSSFMTLKQISDAGLLNDHSMDQQEKDIKCHICMANFPSHWLLEQHTALQHPTLHHNKSAGSSNVTLHDEKPFKCELCGETSRYNCCKYRSTYTNQVGDQNHRARLPADKLFTCDVCGMQFRYLKSFKKHRLNHALERLHGKKEKLGENEPVSSTNENEGVDLSGIKDEENISDEEDQDNTIDSVGVLTQNEHMKMLQDRHSYISSSAKESGANLDDLQKNEPEPSSSSLTSLTTLINSETIPSQQLLGLNPQEASILNFLRVDAAEKQRDRRFACPFCGKCVRSKENLKLHVRKHTGERPFVCLFCGRAFGGKSDLTRHLRIHTGERPYHCESCGKCFARADYLSKHLTTHVHNGPRG